MSKQTSMGLYQFEPTGADSQKKVVDFINEMAGVQSNSNINILNTLLEKHQGDIKSLQSQPHTVTAYGRYSTIADSVEYFNANNTAVTEYKVNTIYLLSFDRTNTAAVNININSVGNRSVKKYNSTGTMVDVEAGDLLKEHKYFTQYDGTQFILSGDTNNKTISDINTKVDGHIADGEKHVTEEEKQQIAGAAAKSYVDEQLGLKADKSNTYSKEDVDGKLDQKADSTTVSELNKTVTQLQQKHTEDIERIDGELGKKADQTSVDAINDTLAKKADLEDGKVPSSQLPEIDPANRLIDVALTVEGWQQTDGQEEWKQNITNKNIKADTKLNISLDTTAITQLVTDGAISIRVDNVDGQGVAVCLGAVPTAVLNVQVEIVNVKKVV